MIRHASVQFPGNVKRGDVSPNPVVAGRKAKQCMAILFLLQQKVKDKGKRGLKGFIAG